MTQPMLFTPLTIRGVRLKNRVVVAPMHQYSAVEGLATDWHLVNAGKYAQGGAGLVIMESTKVARNGCGTVGDTGLWNDGFIPALARCAAFIKAHGAVAGIQLGHSGRKARLTRPWEGGKPLRGDEPEIFDWEGWELVHQFLSPVANTRTDEYGGSELNRMRFAIEVAECVRAVWPADKPLFMRLSCEDDAGWGPDESVRLARLLKAQGVDVIDCSSGGTLAYSPMDGARARKYGYQVPYAEQIRKEADVMTMAVGHIVHADQAEAILQEGRADLTALAREIMYNPNWPMDAAQKLGADPNFDLVPPPYSYWLGKRAKSAFEGKPSTWVAGLGDHTATKL